MVGNNYEEINEMLKLQAQYAFVASSSNSEEP